MGKKQQILRSFREYSIKNGVKSTAVVKMNNLKCKILDDTPILQICIELEKYGWYNIHEIAAA